MPHWKHQSKPVIGLAGGIGSGKSSIARLLASRGCAVIDSDADAHAVLQSAAVKAALLEWLGPEIFHPDGSVNRSAVGARIFTDAAETERLNALIHPRVAALRKEQMAGFLADPAVKAIIWDTPLLFEVGLNTECDAVIFVAASREKRLQRVAESRHWGAGELDKRENLQFPLDKKAELADYCMDNSGDAAASLGQVDKVLSQILASGN